MSVVFVALLMLADRLSTPLGQDSELPEPPHAVRLTSASAATMMLATVFTLHPVGAENAIRGVLGAFERPERVGAGRRRVRGEFRRSSFWEV
jgi:hypothetical protein